MTNTEAAMPRRARQASMPSLRPSALAYLLGLVVAGSHGPCRAGGPTSAEIRETFAGDAFDRGRWSVDRLSPPGVRVDLGGEALRIAVPPGAAGRPPAALRALFSIEGDFDIRVDYAIEALPRPSKEWSNVEIFIAGPDGAAAVIRTNHATLGDGYTLWCEPAPGRGVGGAWKHVPTGDKAGTLRLERIGQELRFSAAARGGEVKPIGSAPFGDRPIRQLEIRAISPTIRSALAFQVDDVTIRAGRLIEPPKPADSMFGRGAWALVAPIVLGPVALWTWWRKTR